MDRLPPTSPISLLGPPAAAHQNKHAANPDGDGANREHQREIGAGEGDGGGGGGGGSGGGGGGVTDEAPTTGGVVDTAVVGVTVIGWVQGP